MILCIKTNNSFQGNFIIMNDIHPKDARVVAIMLEKMPQIMECFLDMISDFSEFSEYASKSQRIRAGINYTLQTNLPNFSKARNILLIVIFDDDYPIDEFTFANKLSDAINAKFSEVFIDIIPEIKARFNCDPKRNITDIDYLHKIMSPIKLEVLNRLLVQFNLQKMSYIKLKTDIQKIFTINDNVSIKVTNVKEYLKSS